MPNPPELSHENGAGSDSGTRAAAEGGPRPEERPGPDTDATTQELSGGTKTATTRADVPHRLSAPRAATRLPRGANVDRYLILEVLGAGGMGVVYSAYDPDLDRKVAIKLLRREFGGEEGRARLHREAQALAKLSHPNVVSVYDVGLVGDQVFLAMEMLEGITMKEWLRTGRRSWQEIVAVFVDAAEGLSAAHDVGLVHRDFKPSNVLIDNRGRTKIVDFGVSRPPDPTGETGLHDRLTGRDLDSAASEPSEPAAAELETDELVDLRRRSALSTPLTRANAIVGTPAYMAPEQRRGVATTLSDQYSFCLTLCEALTGRRLTAGEAIPRDEGDYPSWLSDIIERGMAVSPAERYPSMRELADALGRRPAPRHKRIWLAAGLLVTGAAVAGALLLRPSASAPAPCTNPERTLAGIWDSDVKQRLERNFASTELSYASDTYQRMAGQLDRYFARWQSMRTEACEATHVHHEQSTTLLDLRMACLDRRRDSAAALTRVYLGELDGDMVSRAVDATRRLESLSDCANSQSLLDRAPPPASPGIRPAVRQLREQLQTATALTNAGKGKPAVELAEQAAASAAKLDYRPVQAEALEALGYAQYKMGDIGAAEATFYRLARAATEIRDDRLLADALIWLYRATAQAARFDEAATLGRVAELALVRLPRAPGLVAQLRVAQGLMEWDRGKFAAAEKQFRAALEQTDELGEDHADLLIARNGLGLTLSSQGRKDEALTHLRRCLEIDTRNSGPEHPDIAVYLNNIGIILDDQGRYDEALEHYQRALAIWTRAYGDDHYEVANVNNNIGELLRGRGQHERAMEHYRKALAVAEKGYAPDHPYVALFLVNLATVEILAGNTEDGFARCQRALAIQDAKLPVDHVDRAYGLACIARAYLAKRQPRLAVAPAAQAVALHGPTPEEPAELADAQFLLARALSGANRDRGRSLELARAAADGLRTIGAHEDKIDAIDDWLAARANK